VQNIFVRHFNKDHLAGNHYKPKDVKEFFMSLLAKMREIMQGNPVVDLNEDSFENCMEIVTAVFNLVKYLELYQDYEATQLIF